MELIVISDPGTVQNEAAIINALFSAGLQRFHFRKPGWDDCKCAEVMEAVHAAYRPAIALHQHHGEAARFGIKGLHFNRENRQNTNRSRLMKLSEEQYVLSTSIHALEEQDSASAFDYAFFSPVFESVSKPGYSAKLPKDFQLSKRKGRPRLFALGGVCADNLADVSRMNFDGAAVLGSVWRDPETAVSSFTQLKQRMEQINADR